MLPIVGWWKTPATSSHAPQDSSWVEHANWLEPIPSWLEANNIFLRTSHFFSLSTFCPIPHQQIIRTHTPQPTENGSDMSESSGASSNASLAGTQLQCRHQLVHHDTTNTATRNVTQNAHSKIICKTGTSKIKNQHGIGCNYIHIEVNWHQLTI